MNFDTRTMKFLMQKRDKRQALVTSIKKQKIEYSISVFERFLDSIRHVLLRLTVSSASTSWQQHTPYASHAKNCQLGSTASTMTALLGTPMKVLSCTKSWFRRNCYSSEMLTVRTKSSEKRRAASGETLVGRLRTEMRHLRKLERFRPLQLLAGTSNHLN